jgi:SAM-dependent methyltransferase
MPSVQYRPAGRRRPPSIARSLRRVADRAHWDERYRTVGSSAVSWFEERPTVSLELLAAAGVGPVDSVIDVGGGASRLVDHLLAAGHTDVTVLDISAEAIEEARLRLGDPPAVTWLVEDLLRWEPARRWAAWHDRAMLHFLVDDADRTTYATVLGRALLPGGGFVIGTFAEDGPTECSGLPVRRYAPEDLDALVALAGDVEITARRRHVHRTPGGADQPFNWIAGRLLS